MLLHFHSPIIDDKKIKKRTQLGYLHSRSLICCGRGGWCGLARGESWPGVKVCPGMDCETVDPLMKKDKLTPLHVQLALVCYIVAGLCLDRSQ